LHVPLGLGYKIKKKKDYFLLRKRYTIKPIAPNPKTTPIEEKGIPELDLNSPGTNSTTTELGNVSTTLSGKPEAAS